MCDWQGGPNEMANYVTPQPEPEKGHTDAVPALPELDVTDGDRSNVADVLAIMRVFPATPSSRLYLISKTAMEHEACRERQLLSTLAQLQSANQALKRAEDKWLEYSDKFQSANEKLAQVEKERDGYHKSAERRLELIGKYNDMWQAAEARLAALTETNPSPSSP